MLRNPFLLVLISIICVGNRVISWNTLGLSFKERNFILFWKRPLKNDCIMLEIMVKKKLLLETPICIFHLTAFVTARSATRARRNVFWQAALVSSYNNIKGKSLSTFERQLARCKLTDEWRAVAEGETPRPAYGHNRHVQHI